MRHGAAARTPRRILYGIFIDYTVTVYKPYTTLPQVILPGTLFATFPRAHDLAHTSEPVSTLLRRRIYSSCCTDTAFIKLTTMHESCMV